MPPRRRSTLLALIVTGFYVAAVAVAGVVAAATGDLALLWRLTIMQEPDAGATGPDVLIAVLAAVPWAWALWQCLRGPLETAPREEEEPRVRRARFALYAAAATTLLLHPLPAPWPWWADTVSALSMWAVAVLIHPVLVRPALRPRLARAETIRSAGAVAFGGMTVLALLGLVGLPEIDPLYLVVGVATLIWTVLVLLAQRDHERWRPVTVAYGIAALVTPYVSLLVAVVLVMSGTPVEPVSAPVGGLGALAGALQVIWLARSGHDLAAPASRPVPVTG
ncbi:hypothetical protein AB0L44_15600 [Nonomuraea wenchangensis]|uniref:hypothetical protein n=1 Tax=Nonomuraea wenchangensis TaxID=568860 RepID=UPI00341D95EC